MVSDSGSPRGCTGVPGSVVDRRFTVSMLKKKAAEAAFLFIAPETAPVRARSVARYVGDAGDFAAGVFDAYRWRNLSMRPAVSTTFCLPV